MKKIALTFSTAAVKRHIIRAAAKCALAKVILLLTCARVFALFVLHRAALANMEIHRRICQAVEYAGRYIFCSRNSDEWGDFRDSGEPRGPGPQLRSTEREKAEGHKKLHIQFRWIWPWIEKSCNVSEQVRRTKMEGGGLWDKELLSHSLGDLWTKACSSCSWNISISLRWQCWPVVGRKIGFTSNDKKSSSLSILMSSLSAFWVRCVGNPWAIERLNISWWQPKRGNAQTLTTPSTDVKQIHFRVSGAEFKVEMTDAKSAGGKNKSLCWNLSFLRRQVTLTG